MNKRRMCFAVDLRDDKDIIERYKELHMPGGPPAAVTRSLRDAGISELEIYLIANRLFMIMEVDERYSANEKSRVDAHIPEVRTWNALMETLQQELPFSNPDVASGKWRCMERIYSLAAQP
ncbi:MAG: L-rhamnose mutarotase [Povalibacter sp.]